MSYEIGDIVKVREDLQEDTKYFMSNGINFEYFSGFMSDYKGKTVRIADISENDTYILDGDNSRHPWRFTDGMLERLPDEMAA